MTHTLSLHERIAIALKWTTEQAYQTPLTTLRSLVQPINSYLATEITYAIYSGRYTVARA